MHDNLLKLVQQQFGLQIEEKALPLVEPQFSPLPHSWQQRIEPGQDLVTPTSNECTRSTCIVSQLLLSLALTQNVSLFTGIPLEVNWTQGWVGVPDYVLSRSPLTFRIHPPVVLVVEVKRELERGLSHCLVEMAAAQQFNQADIPVYGALTTGLQWQFLKLQGNLVTISPTVYDLGSLDDIAMTLLAMIQD